MMAAIDRSKYMDEREAKLLRATAENRAIHDLRKACRQGVVTWMVVDLAMQTGLRVSEMAALRVGDFDAKRTALRVIRLKRKQKTKRHESLAISKDLAEHLSEYIGWKQAFDEDTSPTAPLLVGKRGPLTSQGLMQMWKVAIRHAGLPKELSIHSARHTMAVHLLRKTGNLRMVQKQLGHASPAATANLYADVSFEDMQAGVTGLYGGGE